jgi:hypothetical protein
MNDSYMGGTCSTHRENEKRIHDSNRDTSGRRQLGRPRHRWDDYDINTYGVRMWTEVN